MESRQAQVEPGAVVEASDGRFGTVDEVIARPGSGELAFLRVRPDAGGETLTVPADDIASIPSRRVVRLRATRGQVNAGLQGGTLETRPVGNEAQVRVPLAAERLTASTRPVELGEVRVHKRVDTVEEVLHEPITRDEVTVERVRTSRPFEGSTAPREEGEWLIIPVVEEVLVVQKRLMVTEEIRIRRQPVTELQEIRGTVRRERAEIEDATTGRAMHHAADAHPDTSGEAPTGPTGDTWERLREEIREGADASNEHRA